MTIIEKLTRDILHDAYFNALFEKSALISAYSQLNLVYEDNLSDKELKDALRFADLLSNSTNEDARNKAYQIITFLNDKYSNNPIYKTFSKAVYSKLGNFPAIKYIIKYNKNCSKLPLNRLIEFEAKSLIQKVPNSDDLIFTDAQFKLYSGLINKNEYSFSGPTSMGKSFIIKAFIKKIIQNSPPENLVVIVPTRALINQFAMDLKQELSDLLERFRYQIITNSNISDLITNEPHNYIFVLTPERLINYLSQDSNPSIGFLFVDEAHKLGNNTDIRSITLYTAIENTLNKFGNIKLYFASPNVSNPQTFLELFSREGDSYKTNESPVSQNLFFIDLVNNKIEYIIGKNKKEIKTKTFFAKNNSINDLINNIGNKKSNLIYCNGKAKTIRYAFKFTKTSRKKTTSELSNDIIEAIEQIKKYIHPDYYLASFLEYGVAYHYGKLPQLIRNLVEDLYKKGEVMNVFCTSTLLEGVNMPTQNIFIIDGKNGHSKLEPIDFWNLSGRAGRFTRELYGNIYCINHDDFKWDNQEILIKEDIKLSPTVTTRIDKNIIKIEKILKDEKISGTEIEKEILQYIANIISVDTMELNTNREPSPLLKKLIKKNKNTIIELAKSKIKDFSIPSSILNSNQTINLRVQNKVYNKLLKLHNEGKTIAMPSLKRNPYKICKKILTEMYDLYEWNKANSKLQNKNSLSYYATLMNKWINGFTLSDIIKQSIDYYNKNEKMIYLGYGNKVQFDAQNTQHINNLIEDIVEDIEYVLRFLFEKYFNHHYSIVVQLVGERNAGENWATLLEYGTQNRIVIALQNIGLSRNTAISVYNNCREDGLTIEQNKLIKIKKERILQKYKRGSLEYNELTKLL